MTEEIKLGVYESLLNDYESDKEKHAADLAYAACCLVDTVTSEEIAGNENAVTFAVGLPLALSGIDEEIWKGYLSKPVNGTEKLKEFLEGISRWHRQNVNEDTDDPGKVDYDSMVELSKFFGDDWYSKFFEYVRFCKYYEGKNDSKKLFNEIRVIHKHAKSDRFKILLCIRFFTSETSFSKEISEYLKEYSYCFSEMAKDTIEVFTNESTPDPFILFYLAEILHSVEWSGEPDYKRVYELCGDQYRLSEASFSLGNLYYSDESYSEACKWYEKGAPIRRLLSSEKNTLQQKIADFLHYQTK